MDLCVWVYSPAAQLGKFTTGNHLDDRYSNSKATGISGNPSKSAEFSVISESSAPESFLFCKSKGHRLDTDDQWRMVLKF